MHNYVSTHTQTHTRAHKKNKDTWLHEKYRNLLWYFIFSRSQILLTLIDIAYIFVMFFVHFQQLTLDYLNK